MLNPLLLLLSERLSMDRRAMAPTVTYIRHR